MAIGQSAGVLFKIQADASQAERELNSIKGEIGGLGGAFNALGGPGAIATAAVTAMATAAVAAVAGIAKLTLATSEFGSKLYDASIQTGLSAKSISALKVAADTSGSSLESVSNAVSKLNVLVGQAANGNDKAKATLDQYGITAKTANEAFEQAVQVIGEMTNQTEKAAAMAALFKDRTGALGPVLDAIGGDFRAFTADAERLGLTLTEQDLKAADEFGDTLDILSKQAAAAGQQFALELMPNVTHAMQTISGEMVNNQGIARSWGRELGDIIRGLEVAIGSLRALAETQFAGLNLILGQNSSSWANWAIEAVASMNPVIAGLIQLNKLGKQNPIGQMVYEVGDEFSPAPLSRVSSPTGSTPKAPRAGRTPRDTSASDAERARREAERAENERLSAIREGLRQEVAEKAAHNAYLLARFRADLAAGIISEEDAMSYRQNLEREFLAFKIDQLEKEKEAFKGRLEDEKRLTSEIAILNKEIETSLEENREENHKSQMRRQDEAIKKFRDEGKAILDLIELERQRAARDRLAGPGDLGLYGGDIPQMVQPAIDAFERIKESLTSLGQDGLIMQTIGQFAQGIGQLVQNFVLLGTAGPNAMKKLVASVLAGVAAQAAVQAIMFTAYGLAALTPWGAAIYGPATQWFKAAALMAIVAASTGLIGRKVAGDSFSGAAGGSGSGNGNGASQQTNFGQRFRGFGQNPALTEAINRNTMVTAAAEETNNQLLKRLQGFSPEAVVALGANGASRAIRGAIENELSSDVGTTDAFMRGLTLAR